MRESGFSFLNKDYTGKLSRAPIPSHPGDKVLTGIL
jgi:hypothetical protein